MQISQMFLILNLPASSGKLKFKGDSIDIVSDIYTAAKGVSKINGVIKSGKHPNIDINFKSGQTFQIF